MAHTHGDKSHEIKVNDMEKVEKTSTDDIIVMFYKNQW